MKKQTGISLIALMVTIVVLLILAGVSVNMLIGDNGIIPRAKNAREVIEKAEFEESIKLAYLKYKIEKQTKDENANLGTFLSTIEDATVTAVSENITDDMFLVEKNDMQITVYESGKVIDGTVSVWDGQTVECPKFKEVNGIWNWYIYTAGQLKFLADYVNNGQSLTGEANNNLASLVTNAGYQTANVTIIPGQTMVRLMNNLDMGARMGKGTTDAEKWETQENEAKKFTPIGNEANYSNFTTSKEFTGIFRGNDYIISNMYINTTGNAGLFGGICLLVSDITIKDSYIKTTNGNCGAVASVMLFTANNCHNVSTSVIGTDYVGGVFGSLTNTASITDCSNSGSVKGTGYVGGIAGQISTQDAQVSNCKNTGSVTGTENFVGGIIGNSYENVKIKDCKNLGKVISNGQGVGGILGSARLSINISDCINKGNITADDNRVGGILGGDTTEYEGSSISKCNNSGTITGKADFTGGIAGCCYSTISLCNNNGIINGVYSTGGIVGAAFETIYECKNNASISSNNNFIGGIAGIIYNTTVSKCVNYGTIKQKGETAQLGVIGGIVGSTSETSETNVTVTNNILNCYNRGTIVEEVDSTRSVGGIVGYIGKLNASGTVKYNYSVGTINVTGTNVTNVGGTIGEYNGATFEIHNNYHLENKSNVELNEIDIELTAAEMKSQEFVNLLNTSQNPAVWKLKTDGYPIFITDDN